MLIDRYAYTNKLKRINPVEKIVVSLMTLSIVLFISSIKLHLFVIFTMGFLILFVAKIPSKVLMKMLLIPVPFLLISILTIMINIANNPESFNYGLRVYSLYIGITNNSILEGATIFFRSLASIFCVFFLSLTTPITDITNVMRKIKIPMIFVEMFTIIYRFIFVLIETAIQMKLSQECRLGYYGYKRSYYSLGLLVTNLFIKAYEKHKMLYLSLVSRGYDGDLNVLDKEYSISYRNTAMISLYITVLIIIAIV